MLTAITGSMVSVAGVALSITLVTLSLASKQCSPRVLRNFLADRATPSVLGVFVGVFTSCPIVLQSIRGPGGTAFVPDVAVPGGIILAFAAIGFLIFFIHHVATLSQPSAILERTAAETCRSLDGWVFDDDGPIVDRRSCRPAVPEPLVVRAGYRATSGPSLRGLRSSVLTQRSGL